MIIQDSATFKSISRLFLLLALIVYAAVAYWFKKKGIEITYSIVLKLVLLVLFPIISFPFLVLSNMDVQNKIYATLFALFLGLSQFYITKSVREMLRGKKTSTDVKNDPNN